MLLLYIIVVDIFRVFFRFSFHFTTFTRHALILEFIFGEGRLSGSIVNYIYSFAIFHDCLKTNIGAYMILFPFIRVIKYMGCPQ